MNIYLKLYFALMAALCVTMCSGCDFKALKKYPQDNVIEEVAEDITEKMIEKKMDLPSGSLNGKIDFTPSSPETK